MSIEQSKIFLDKRKLSTRYVPPILPHRDKQLQELDDFFRGSLAEPSKDFLMTLQIIGPAGSGKTSTVTHFGADFEKEARKLGVNLQHVYVNLKLQGGSRVLLYRYILNNVAPKLYSPGYGAEEMLRILLEQLTEEKKYLLISLDEIDYFIKSTKDGGVVYDLTRLNEINPKKPCNVLGVIFIARSKEFHDKLDRAELSTLGRLAMEFPSYRSKEIVDILTERVREAFVPGVVSDEVLEYIADVTVPQPVGGDLRYALDLLLYAGNLAEAQGSGRLLPEHVRRVHSEMQPSITEEDILDLPKKEHLIVLLAVVRSLRGSKKAYASMKDIRLNCAEVCEEMRLKPIADIDDYIQDLSDRRIIEVESLREIGIKGAPTENLETYLDSLFKRVEAGIVGGS